MTVKSRLLETLEKNKGEILSGEKLAKELNCTRAAIWKAVKTLREEGYKIEAGPNKGYILSVDSNKLSEEAIRLCLNQKDVSIEIYKEIDSTNKVAKQLAVFGKAKHGSLVLAQSQSEGRGRRGRAFYSPKDAGIYMSIVLEPSENLQGSLLLTTAAATAVYKAVKKVCGISLGIKWVNDLYKENRKVCGILTEAITDFETGDIQYAIVGIGLNIYQDRKTIPEELKEIAGALYSSQEEAEKLDKSKLVAEIINFLLEEVSDLKLSQEYVDNNIVPGNNVTVLDGNRTRDVFVKKITEDGKLLVQEKDGTYHKLSFGEISIKI